MTDDGTVKVVTAAAQRLVKTLASKASTKTSSSAGWQSTAWGFWDDTPEVRFGSTWIGNQMGRARLFAGRRQPDGSVAALPPEHPASDLVATIAGGPTGQAEMLTEFGPHLVVAGEAWVVVTYNNNSEQWHIVSTEETTSQRGTLSVELDGSKIEIPPFDPEDPPELNDTTPLAIRVWQPHPRRHIEADSPIRSSFALLEELRLLNAAVAAISKSRLTGRGILFIPKGASFPKAAGSSDEEDDLMATLMEAASIAYSDPDSAAAAVPLLMEVDSETLAAINHVTFESTFDDLAVKLREETIRRFAAGLDTPAEVLLGMSDVNHWGQWAIDESAIRIAVEPRLGLVCNALTEQWLVPALSAFHPEVDLEGVVVWADTSALRVRTNRSQTAMELYDRGEIGGDALRRETDFDDSDKASPADQDRALLIRLVSNAPSLAPVILPMLGFDIDLPVPGEAPPEDGGGIDDEVELPVDEEQSPPDGPDDDGDAALFAAVDGVLWRAMEKAGQRLRSRAPRARRPDLQDLDAAAVHCETPAADSAEVEQLGLLDDAWERVPEIARRYGCNAELLASLLAEHCETLLCTGVAYCWDDLPRILRPLRTFPAGDDQAAA